MITKPRNVGRATVANLRSLLPASRFGRRAVLMGGGAVFNQILQALTVPIIGALYGPSLFGEWAIIQSIGAILATLCGLRYELAVVIADGGEEVRSVIALQAISAIGIALLATGLILPFRSALAARLGPSGVAPWLLITPLLALVTALSFLASNCLIRKQRFRQLAIFGVAQSGSIALAQIACFFIFRRTLTGLVIGGLASIVAVLAMLAYLAYNFPLAPWPTRRSLLHGWWKHFDFPRYNATWSLIAALRDRGIVILLGIGATARITGFYALAQRLTYAPQGLASTSMNSVLFQRAAEEPEVATLAPLVAGILGKMVRIAVPAFAFLAWWSGDLLTTFVGRKWEGAGVYVAILCAPALCLFLQGWMDRLLAVVGGLRTGFIIETLYTVVGMAVFSVTLWRFHSALGAVIAFAVISVAYNIALLIAYYQQCRFPYAGLIQALRSLVVLTTAALLLLAAVSAALPPTAALVVDACLGSAYYVWLLFAFRAGWPRKARTEAQTA